MAEKTKPQLNLDAFNCPICSVYAKQTWSFTQLYGKDKSGHRGRQILSNLESFSVARCEYCDEVSIWSGNDMIFPPRDGRRPFDLSYVPAHISEDYTEACLVLPFSPKASAALSRRCLQTILREHGFTDKSLQKEIQNAIDSKMLPSHITENIDSIRNVGNFASHPLEDIHTGEIQPVEKGEAEWNLDVLESLFDFYYIQPVKTQIRKAQINQKLTAVGKPKMK